MTWLRKMRPVFVALGLAVGIAALIGARTLTNGTVGTVDHEDAHTVTVALAGYLFEKTVADLTTGASPAPIASSTPTGSPSCRVGRTNTS